MTTSIGITGANVALAHSIGEVFGTWKGCKILGGDFNSTPDAWCASKFPSLWGLPVALNTAGPTCFTPEGDRQLDFFLGSRGIDAWFGMPQVDLAGITSPHKPVLMTTLARLCDTFATVQQKYVALSASKLIGPTVKEVATRCEDLDLIAKADTLTELLRSHDGEEVSPLMRSAIDELYGDVAKLSDDLLPKLTAPLYDEAGERRTRKDGFATKQVPLTEVFAAKSRQAIRPSKLLGALAFLLRNASIAADAIAAGVRLGPDIAQLSRSKVCVDWSTQPRISREISRVWNISTCELNKLRRGAVDPLLLAPRLLRKSLNYAKRAAVEATKESAASLAGWHTFVKSKCGQNGMPYIHRCTKDAFAALPDECISAGDRLKDYCMLQETTKWSKQWGEGEFSAFVLPTTVMFRKPVSSSEIANVSRLFKVNTGVGSGGIHPRSVSLLPEDVQHAVAATLAASNSTGHYPSQVSVLLVLLQGKPTGGTRPIGLYDGIVRIDQRVNRSSWKTIDDRRRWTRFGGTRSAPKAPLARMPSRLLARTRTSPSHILMIS